MTLVSILLILSAFLFLIGGTIIFATKRKYKKLDLKSDTLNNPITRFIVARFRPADMSEKYIKLSNNLNTLTFKTSVEQFYAFKTLVAVVVLILAVCISATNYNFAKTATLRNMRGNGSSAIGPVQAQTSDVVNADNIVNYYNIVDSKLVLSTQLSLDKATVIENISSVLSANTSLKSRDIEVIAPILYFKATQMTGFFSIGRLTLFLGLMMAGFIVPNFILHIYCKARQQAFNQEVYNLETLVLLLGSMENITVRYIISELINNSVVFKSLLKEFFHIYCANREDAYTFILDSGINPELERLISALRMCEQSNRAASIGAVARKRLSKKEFSKIERETKLERRDLLCLALYFAVFILIIMVFITPWTSQLDVLQSF